MQEGHLATLAPQHRTSPMRWHTSSTVLSAYTSSTVRPVANCRCRSLSVSCWESALQDCVAAVSPAASAEGMADVVSVSASGPPGEPAVVHEQPPLLVVVLPLVVREDLGAEGGGGGGGRPEAGCVDAAVDEGSRREIVWGSMDVTFSATSIAASASGVVGSGTWRRVTRRPHR